MMLDGLGGEEQPGRDLPLVSPRRSPSRISDSRGVRAGSAPGRGGARGYRRRGRSTAAPRSRRTGVEPDGDGVGGTGGGDGLGAGLGGLGECEAGLGVSSGRCVRVNAFVPSRGGATASVGRPAEAASEPSARSASACTSGASLMRRGTQLVRRLVRRVPASRTRGRTRSARAGRPGAARHRPAPAVPPEQDG